ncbi:hypothetical protein GE061_015165 [Apolygus lucorum]|uniref:Uncharacterized protein n=1 Tax=Apolygus lucorum TaxID=248454 RepID=A0A8S9XME7_APOLU|nr:hypothetical protein GE061_015165 [Apolygus lucorum]
MLTQIALCDIHLPVDACVVTFQCRNCFVGHPVMNNPTVYAGHSLALRHMWWCKWRNHRNFDRAVTISEQFKSLVGLKNLCERQILDFAPNVVVGFIITSALTFTFLE